MKKGFTLIELLAVIVILAIIALIATPIILNIIEDSRNSANQRSVDLYKSAIVNAIAKSQMTSNPIQPGDLSSEFLQTIEYSGATVSCTTNRLYSDGSIYLAGCTVGNDTKEYSYGVNQYNQVNKPLYYWWGLEEGPENGGYLLEAHLTEPPVGKNIYIGYNEYQYDVMRTYDIYICFKRNGNEYCIEYKDNDSFATNVEVINDAFSDIKDDPNSCTFVPGTPPYSGSITCDDGNIRVSAWGDGSLQAVGADYMCNVGEFGASSCESNGT